MFSDADHFRIALYHDMQIILSWVACEVIGAATVYLLGRVS